MCAIAGVVRRTRVSGGDVARAEKMATVMRHRGPDDRGLRGGRNYAFAHRRLSIIDIEGGHQPMANESETVWLVFNGEIYNFRELRRELEAQGHQFRTRCDTEVIIHLYEEHGAGCVSRLNGMFAFALFDEDKKLLLMARDRAGIKPLYYSYDGSVFSFASEAKALVQTSPRLVLPDERSIIDFFSLSLLQEGRTAFKGINQLRPAHCLVWSLDKQPREIRYWRLAIGSAETADGDVAGKVSGLLDEAVGSHLVSDVPVGTYLSGGLDSSLVSAIAGRHLSTELKTFSCGFTGKQSVDERAYAREVSRALGSLHYEIEVGPQDFLAHLRKIIWHMAEPTLSPGVYPYYFLCELVSRSVKVVLGGQGGDELFGGYPRYSMALLEDRMKGSLARGRLPGFAADMARYRRRYGWGGLRNGLRRLPAPDERRIYEIVSGFHPRRLPRLLSKDFIRETDGYDPYETFTTTLDECGSGGLIDRMLYNDYNNMLASILRTEDRMSMAHSIESRVPFLDYRLVELAATIPSSMKVGTDGSKFVLKQVARGQVPDSVINRSKQGFSAPLASWLDGGLGSEVRDLLLSRQARSRGYFSPAYVEKVIDRALKRHRDIWRLWSLVTFEMWCRIFADGEGA